MRAMVANCVARGACIGELDIHMPDRAVGALAAPGKMSDLPDVAPMFNDIVAAERPATLDSPYGVTFADLYTVEGAARIDELFLAELGAADAPLSERYARARRSP